MHMYMHMYRPPCLPARLFLGILAVCAPDSRLRRQPTDYKTLFIHFFACFSSFVWVRLGPGVRGRGGGDRYRHRYRYR
jgi:hypothetical protein